MKKKMRSAAIAGAAVLLLAGIALLLLLLPEETADSSPGHTHEHSEGEYIVEQSTGAMIIDMDYPDLDRMVVKNKEGTYTMRANADGTHTIDELMPLPVNDSFISMAMAYGVTLGYSKVILDPEGNTPPLTQYGLSDPAFTVEVHKKNGETVTYHAGIEVPDSEGMYYFTVDGYQGVFVSELSPALSLGDSYWLSDVIYADDEKTDAEDIGRMAFSGSRIPEAFVIEPHKPADESDPYFSSNYIQTSPFVWACDNYYMSLLRYELGYLSADEAVCAFPTDGQKAEYGLADPALTVSYTRAGKPYTIECSPVTGEYFYFLINTADCIYRQKADSYEVLSSVTDTSLLSSDVHVRQFSALSSIELECGEERYLFRLEEKISENGGLASYAAYCGEKEIPLAEYKDLLEVFNSAICVEMGAEALETEPYMTVRLTYFDKFSRESETITYTSTGQRRYLCSVNGQAHGAVSYIWTEQLLAAARNTAGK